MKYLEKNDALFIRDEKGELLPVSIPLNALEKFEFVNKEKVVVTPAPFIKVLPIPRGKWLRLLSMKDEEQDLLILKEHVVEPLFTDTEYKTMKPLVMSAIVTAVTVLTLDLKTEQVAGKTKKELTEAEEWELKKEGETPKTGLPSSCTNKDTPSSTLGVSPITKSVV